MGFAPGRIESALRNTNGELEECIAWIEEHQAQFDEAVKKDAGVDSIDQPAVVDNTNQESSEQVSAETAEAPKAPLSEEEKAAKLDILKEKARLRKEEQAKKDNEEKKRNEAILKKQTKETRKIVEEQQQKEAIKEAARRREQAKEDAMAKKRIKDLIEADKRARQEERARREGKSLEPSSTTPVVASRTEAPAPRAAPTESKIRFRVQGASVNPFMKTYALKTTLGGVAEDIAGTVGASASSIQFMTTFPTQTFTSNDFSATLEELKLVNTNLIVKI